MTPFLSLGALLFILFVPRMVIGGEAEQSILRAQDERDAIALGSYLRSQDDKLLLQAAIASASVQDTTLLNSLILLLEHDLAKVRSAAAFALGQMTVVVSDAQRKDISGFLLQRVGTEVNEDALLRAIEAIGKTGDSGSLERMIEKIRNGSEPARGEAALSVGRFAYRNIKSHDATRFVAEFLQHGKGETWKAGYALMRIGVDSLLSPYRAVMASGFGAGDANLRMFLATAIGAAGGEQVVSQLIGAARNDDDWRVRVNATRALTRMDSEEVTATLIQLNRDSNEHVSLTALLSLRARGLLDSALSESVWESLAGLVEDTSKSQRQRGSAAVTLASLFHARAAGRLEACYGKGLLREEDYIEGLAFFDDDETFNRLLAFSRSDNPRTARIALDALDVVIRRDPDNEKRKKGVIAVLLSSLQSDDMAVMTTAATALGDSMYSDSGAGPVLTERLGDLKTPDDVESIVAMIQTLGTLRDEGSVPALQSMLDSADRTVSLEAALALEKITGRSFMNEVPAHSDVAHTDYDWLFLEGLQGSVVDVETSAGIFTFELLPEAAPFTCVNFARLIQDGFYDGLIFHRVVPNFVVQGGDPRGDGWGGPGYSIRSEFGMETYERGMVGVASAGKDTEGCQLFVTHSKQPHLDGRYTIFGKVVSGMEVVDKIQVGDRILKMKRGTRNAERETK